MEEQLVKEILENYENVSELYKNVDNGFDLAAWINYRLKNTKDLYKNSFKEVDDFFNLKSPLPIDFI